MKIKMKYFLFLLLIMLGVMIVFGLLIIDMYVLLLFKV